MPEVGDYYSMRLTPADVRAGDLLTINSPGELVSFEDKRTRKNITKVRLDLLLPNGKIKEYVVNSTSFKSLSEQWGTNTDKWVGKTVTASVGILPNGNRTIYIFPTEDRGGIREVRGEENIPF
jgi:hypothetical protein